LVTRYKVKDEDFMVIGWIKYKFSEQDFHALDTETKAKVIFDDIQKRTDAISAITEITQWLKSVADEENFSLARRIDIVTALDSLSRKHYEKILIDYLSVSNSQKEDSFRHHFLIAHFANNLMLAWMSVHKHHEFSHLSDKESKKHPCIRPMALAKSMFACGILIKWTHFQYKSVDTETWKNIALILSSSVAIGGFDISVKFSGAGEKYSSCYREFMAIMMAEMTPYSGLLPIQIELSSRIIRLMLDSFALSKEHTDAFSFAFDIKNPREPFRMNEGVTSKSLLFFPGAKYINLLNVLIQQVKDRAELNPALTIGVHCTYKDIEDILALLKSHWSSAPPKRKHERLSLKKHLTIFHSFETIRSAVSRYENIIIESEGRSNEIRERELVDLKIYGFVTDKTKEMKKETAALQCHMPDKTVFSNIEEWVMDNISAYGCGAYVPSVAKWAKIGAVIGMVSDDDRQLSIGVIRRFSAARFKQKYAGIQIFSREPKTVRLREFKPDHKSGNLFNNVDDQAVDGKSALLLPFNTYTGQEATLLASPSVYRQGRLLVIQYKNKTSVTVKLIDRTEKFDDCELMTFRMMHEKDYDL
jgi:hypothetical protein